MIASAEASDLLALPSDGRSLERKQWRVKPCLVPEFGPILDRIRELVAGGLTSMHVLGDFLKRRVMPLQGRPRLSCWFTGPSDIDRIHRGPGTDLTWEELEISVRGVTSEAFIPESLTLPRGFHRSATILGCGQRSWPACRPSMRVVWRSAKPVVGIPTGGSTFPAHQAAAPNQLMWPHIVSSAVPSPSDKGKGPPSSSSTPDTAGRSEEVRRQRPRRADGSFVLDLPRDSDSPRSVRRQLVGLRRPNLGSRTISGA